MEAGIAAGTGTAMAAGCATGIEGVAASWVVDCGAALGTAAGVAATEDGIVVVRLLM